MLDLWDQLVDRYKWFLVAVLISVIVIGVGVFLYKTESSSPEVQILSAADEATTSAQIEVVVDISGEVERPGVYRLQNDLRVEDVIQMAGGFTNKVDHKWIQLNLNRAEKIRDGMKLFIPAINEVVNIQNADNIITANTKINLNSASLQELDTLKGVGPVTAQKIIDNRPYSAVDDLLAKKVVGEKIFGDIKDELVAW